MISSVRLLIYGSVDASVQRARLPVSRREKGVATFLSTPLLEPEVIAELFLHKLSDRSKVKKKKKRNQSLYLAKARRWKFSFERATLLKTTFSENVLINAAYFIWYS
jgi:hypothetical protein